MGAPRARTDLHASIKPSQPTYPVPPAMLLWSSLVEVRRPMHPEREPLPENRRRSWSQHALRSVWVALLIWGAATGLVRAAPGEPHAEIAQLVRGGDYQTDSIGSVRWTYPTSARAEVRALQAYQGPAWRRVVGELGATVAPELDIRVALNPEQMQKLAPRGSTLPGYADGIAYPAQGLILLTLTDPDTWMRPDMRSLLTHELSHVALHRAVRGVDLPRWFSEGVAVHQAGESSLTRVKTLWDGTLRGNLMSLDRISVSFPARHGEVDLAYAQSADFVGFMLGGADERSRFHALLAGLSTGMPFADAVKAAYDVPLGYMEREWRDTLTQRFGRWPALLMGLTFVWVIGALLLVIAYVRMRSRSKTTLERWEIEEAPLLEAPMPTRTLAPAPPVTAIDDFFENRKGKDDAGIPTVVHEGQNHTLH